MKDLALPSPTQAAIVQAIRDDPRLKSPHTIAQYRSHLGQFEEWRAGRALTKSLVEAYAAELQRDGMKPSTINQRITIIRWWTRRVIDLAKEQGTDPAEIENAARVLAIRNVDPEGGPEELGRHMETEELRLLLDACDRDPSPAGRRDKAILWMAWSNGLRRATLCSLDLADLERCTFDIDGQSIPGAKIRYISKRRKRGTAKLLGDAWTAMQEWLAVRGQDPGPIFTQVNKSGKVIIPDRPLTVGAIHKWLRTRFLEAGLSKRVTWHTFRYTFAGNLIDEGYDLTTVQALMLHASPAQTSRYDKRKERHQAEAILSLSILGGNHG